ncbi:protein phosphatase 1 regulatory subunit 14C-like [Acanthaster planci]|uniref:Protein phosphatase 1 regulatory subunit 14C-like n=1 Tax=Acanthaster planci TaxID=133434 RepID=A0A8B7Y7P9_ACAPL|nr:protein phosphatase 1 regulatory subunit 14C-like [Acanthaster planci]
MATTGEPRTTASRSLESTSPTAKSHQPIEGRRVSMEAKVSDDKKQKRNIHVTAKYNRKQMRMRLNIEEWMDGQLRQLYECEEDEDYPVEIDIDALLETNVDEERVKFVEDILSDVRQPKETFIRELLQKIEVLS